MSLKSKRLLNVGGFVGVNSGKIFDSYSEVEFSRNMRPGNFCAENSGEIIKCFSNGKKGGKRVKEFCRKDFKKIKSCFLHYVENEENQSVEHGVYKCDFYKTSIDEFDVNLEDYWIRGKSGFISNLDFDPKTWKYQIPKEDANNSVSIYNSEQLIHICENINSGDPKSVKAVYTLKKDIDLNGKKWTPIGDESHPFKGKFDGNGHKIYNFKITDKSIMFTGFFGYIENAVIANLTVDGIIYSSSCSGTLVGVSKDSLISCCKATSYVKPQKSAGGFIGKNSGTIDRCAYSGKIKTSPPFYKILIIPAIIFLLLVLLYFFNPFKNHSVFNNIPVDPASVKKQEMNYTSENNTASFVFSDVITFFNGEGDFDLKNPGTSNQSMQVKIQITDQELLNKTGSTNRSPAEQKSLESSGSYEPSNSRITIAESGLVLPGYYLPKLKLNKLPNNSNLPSGVYSGIAFISFYNYDTNEKAIVDSQMPITIVQK